MQSQENIVTCDKDNTVKIIRKSAILRNKDVAAYYRFIFNECDTDRDGQISIPELKEFLATHEGDVPTKVVACLHNAFDMDKDDQLSFEEFLDLINHPSVTDTFKRIGSRYLKFVAGSSVREKSLKLRRTVTNTGLYEEQFTFNLTTISMIVLSCLQIPIYYIDMYECDYCIRNRTEFDPENKREVWRFTTFILDHSDAGHLYGNIFMQLLLGVPLEMVHSWRVPLIFCVGAIGGALLQSIIVPCTILIGSSPGFYSFYSAHVASVIMNWRETSHPCVHLIIFVVLIAFDAVRNYVLYPNDDKISYISHVGGVVVGLPMGLIVLRNLRATKTEKILLYASVAVLLLLTIVFVSWTAVLGEHPRCTERS